MRPDLAARWAALVTSCGADLARAAPFRAALAAAYSEPHRAHHGLGHVAHLLAELEAVPLREAAVEWAAWYHDVVYVPGRADNESRSAARAEEALRALGLAPLVPRVVLLVLATRDHRAPPGDEAAQLFLDADLAILGAAPSVYDRYAAAVREEHRAIPELLYRLGRRRFLSKTLAAPAVYRTSHFRCRLERQARENLRRELAALSG